VRQIELDYTSVQGPRNTCYRSCVGAGHAALGLRADYQQHLRIVRAECGFERLRFHGLFHEDLAVYRKQPDGSLDYNWQYLDALYDNIVDQGMAPFVELGFMPTVLASGDQTVFDWRANVTPPKSYDAWGELVEQTVRHWVDRYGRSRVGTWLFEVWNEPNHPAFFTGDIEAYFRLYESAALAIKRVCANCRVGGPAAAGCEWGPELIEFCHGKGVPIDFVTIHTYGVNGAIDELGVKQLFTCPEPGPIVDAVCQARSEVEASAMPDLPIHITEWGPTFGSRDPYNDNYACAAFILAKIKRTERVADTMSYWTFSDVFDESGPPPRPFHGGFGLLNLQGLRKPAFFAYRFLHQLGDEPLNCTDDDAWACRSDRGVQVLFWDHTRLDQGDTPNGEFYRRHLPSQLVGDATVTIRNLPAGDYDLAVHEVGYRHNDVQSDYLDMGSPTWLSREAVERLAERNSGAPSMLTKLHVGQNREQVTLPPVAVRENHIFFITLMRVS